MLEAREAARTRTLLPLDLVVFVGFLGYSLMIATFTPMLLRSDNGMLRAGSSLATRSLVLGALLALYPFGQFLGSPVLGALSDRYGRRIVLVASLCATTGLYVAIATALAIQSLPLLMVSCFLAGLSEANIVIAQGAITDRAGIATACSGTSSSVRASPTSSGPWAAGSSRTVGRVVTDRALRPFYLVNFTLYLAIFGFFRVYGRAVATRCPRVLVQVSALAMGALMAVIVLPRAEGALWLTLGLTALALAVCLPSCAAMLSLAAGDEEQGRALGNNQSMQVGAESLSGLLGGALAAQFVKLPLLVFAGAAVVGSASLRRLRTR